MTRILWFHPRALFPMHHGGNIRTRGLIQCALAGGHTILLVTPGTPTSEKPEAFQMLHLGTRQGLSGVLAKLLSRQPLRSPRLSETEQRRARTMISEFAPEIGVVSELMAWSVAHELLPPDIPWIYDAHNVETVLFDELHERAHGLSDRVTYKIDAKRVQRVEQQMVQSAALTLSVSEADAREIRRVHATDGEVHVVPSSVPTPSDRAHVELAKPAALFVGSLDYPPNIEAFRELTSTVWPRVRQRVAATLIVVGRRAPHEVRQLAASVRWIELYEDAANIEPFYRMARCAVLPIRSGGGTKLKLYEALAHGLPVVATPEAVRGVNIHPEEGLQVVSTSAELAIAAIDLLQDDERATRMSRAAREAFTARLSWEAGVQSKLLEAIAFVDKGRDR